MAPEFAPSVVIYDLLRVADGLRGTVQYVERPPTMRVRVRWLEETVPDGYVPVGDGVAYVRETEDLLITKPEAAAIPKTLDGSRYLLAESPRPEDLWRMLIIVFPPAHTVVAPKPLPRGAKDFKGRLALFWVLRGDEEGREEIEWRMEKVEGNPLEQFQHRIRVDAAGGP